MKENKMRRKKKAMNVLLRAFVGGGRDDNAWSY